jgi:hypothetical protein
MTDDLETPGDPLAADAEVVAEEPTTDPITEDDPNVQHQPVEE